MFVTFSQAAVDRRNWQQASGLMPVFEEDEEEINGCPAEEEEEEGEAGEETHDESLLDQKQQVIKLNVQLQKALPSSKMYKIQLKE